MFVKQLTILLSLSSALFAGTSTETAAPATKETSFADDLWSHAVLYQNAEGPFFQKIRVLGRYHTNYAWVEDDTSDWDYRRGRLGLNFEFLTQFELRNEWNVDGLDDDDFDPSFSTIDTLFLTWKANPAFQLTAGKHKAPLTQEFRMSSNEMITVERTVLT